MGILKDLSLFFSYVRTIKKKRVELESRFNIRIDSADRMYTVINVPQNEIEEPYNLRKADIDKLAEKFILEYISELSKFLNSIGLSELYDFYEPIKKVDKYSYLIIIGFKNLDSVEINKIIYRILLPILGLSLFTYLLIKLI